MTGKELIMYILENNLLDTPVIKDDVPIWLMGVSEAAVKFHVGFSTIISWIDDGVIPSEAIGNAYYIPRNITDPRH